MGLLQKCCETYDNHAHLVGMTEGEKSPLVPVAHILQNADIEITVDSKGSFLTASLVAKGEEKTIIPVTIASGGRSGKVVEAHPLCDKLQYMLSSNRDKYESYIQKLEEWCNSAYSNPKLTAVLAYIKSGSILEDLYSCQVISGSTPEEKEAEEKLFIRWCVEGLGSNNVECWLDQELFASWTDYYLSTLSGEKALCMVSGEEAFITENHPKNIIACAANAKLISANDNINFTFRGRFVNAKEAGTVGYVVSQKAHNALRWQASRGHIIGGRVFMCWNPKGLAVPDIWSNFIDVKEEVKATDYKDDLQRSLDGYRLDLPDNEDVIIASMDAATPGRLSLIYYNELKASDFLERIGNWYKTCYWQNGKLGIQSPSVQQIVRCAYGVERKNSKMLAVDDNISRDNQERLLKCILEKAAIPYDVVRCLVLKASRPETYDRHNKYNYRELLFVACAVIRKFLNDRSKKEEWTLELDKDKVERSYLFGRLLAVYEKVERDTYDKQETREPNAIRLQCVYCGKPFYYLNMIEKSVRPYFAKLKPGSRNYYRKLIGEIMEKLAEYEPKELNKSLTETYLLGYYLQRNDLYKAKKVNENESKTEE